MLSKLFRYDTKLQGKQELSTADHRSLLELSMTDNITSVEIPQYRVRGTFVENVIECTKRNMTWQVFRRYQQFKALDQSLKQLCSRGSSRHCDYGVIPVLCGSHWTEVTNQSIDLVEKRRRHLEIYLRQLLVPGNVFYVAKTVIYDFLHDGAVPAQHQRRAIRPLIGFATPDSLADLHLENRNGEGSASRLGAASTLNDKSISMLGPSAVGESDRVDDGVGDEEEEPCKSPPGETVESGEECEDLPSADNSEAEDVRVPPPGSLCRQCNAEFSSVLYPHRCFFCRQQFCRDCLHPVELEEGEVARSCVQCYENFARKTCKPQYPPTPMASTPILQCAPAGGALDPLNLLGSTSHVRTDVTLSDFKLVTTVGRGTFGKVMKVIFREDGKVYAMKVLNKCVIHKRRMIEYIREEKNIMSSLPSHPYIVTCHFAFQTDYHLFFVLDYLPGGDMHSRVYPKLKLTESDVRLYIAELVLALQHLHRHDIAHRDVKLENIVLGEDGHLKLTDFGLARMNFSRQRRRSFVGSPEYLPPETIQGKYQTKAVDWWSAGVMLYEMLSGKTPFYSAYNCEIYNNVLKAELDLTAPCFTPEAASLIEQLLQSHPKARLQDAGAIKAHPYFASIDWAALEGKKISAPIQLDLMGNDMKYIKWKFTAEWAVIYKPPGVTRATIDLLINRFSNFAHVSEGTPPTPHLPIGQQQEEVSDGVTNPPDITGVWNVVKVEMQTEDGKITHPWGSAVCGVLAYFPEGQFSMQLTSYMRPHLRQQFVDRAVREDLVEMCNSYAGSFGKYQIKPGSNIITHRLHGCLCPNLTGSTQKYFFEVRERKENGAKVLKLFTACNALPGEDISAQTVLTWERTGSC
uniref:Zinc finger protein kinase n=1 Tax=Trypanosoma brucei brucei TaxID=5702 RepID=Q965D1_TRYBB|nr:zinc finger protein kinase [Trypanosoma brucei brucei]